jgi:hypothetical protein
MPIGSVRTDELTEDDGRSLPCGEFVPSQVLDRPFTSLEDFSLISNMIGERMHYLSSDEFSGGFVGESAGVGVGAKS